MQLGDDPIMGVYDLGLLLEEISNPRQANGHETGFFHTRFVPWLEADYGHASAAEQSELAEEVLGIPAPRARSKAILNAPGKVQHTDYACALGLARLANISS
jgi:hypothetical protein